MMTPEKFMKIIALAFLLLVVLFWLVVILVPGLLPALIISVGGNKGFIGFLILMGTAVAIAIIMVLL